MHLLQRAVPAPQAEIAVHRAARWQVLRDVAPLAAGAQHIHHAVDHFAHVDGTLAAAALGRRYQRPDLPPIPHRSDRSDNAACRGHSDGGSRSSTSGTSRIGATQRITPNRAASSTSPSGPATDSNDSQTPRTDTEVPLKRSIITPSTAEPRADLPPSSRTGRHSWRWCRRMARRWRSDPATTPPFRIETAPVRTLDVFTTEELRQRAKAPEMVPNIDAVWRGEPYQQLLKQQFNAVVGIASLDHQPCLTTHLSFVSTVLKPGGQYFVALPDRRYGADHFLPDSTLADVLDAFAQRRMRHSARSLAAPLFLGTHDDAARHWAGDHGLPPEARPPEAQHTRAIADILRQVRGGDSYLDARAWQFTPESFQWLLNRMAQYGLSPFRVERLYPTVKPWGSSTRCCESLHKGSHCA